MSSSGREVAGGIPKATGSTEGYYRSYSAKRSTSAGSAPESLTEGEEALSPRPSRPLRSSTVGEVSGPVVGEEKDMSHHPLPPAPQSIERPPQWTNIPNKWRPPDELGRREDEEAEEDETPQPAFPKPTSQRHAPNMRASIKATMVDKHKAPSWRRSMMAIQSSMTQAAGAAALTAELSEGSCFDHEDSQYPSLVTSFAYRGMEVIFTTVKGHVFGIFARTRAVFQTLDDNSRRGDHDSHVISLTSHSVSGTVVVTRCNGTLQTYAPFPTHACYDRPPAGDNEVFATFGRYRWMRAPMMDLSQIFYPEGSACDFSKENTHVSVAMDDKILVAHKKQLAIADAFGFYPSTTERKSHADLVWTTEVAANVHDAKISGDGQALVVAMEHGEDSMPGAQVYVRDIHDGSKGDLREDPPLIPPRAASTVGILYKPGPFLEHTAPVSQLSFRGLGNVTSSVSFEQQGNDLLLTYCRNDCSARVFAQNGWKQLIHWTTPARTRVEWIHGLSALCLGDLEATTHNRKSSLAGSRRPSFSSGENSVGFSNLLQANSRPFQSPTHRPITPPSTAAGAWILEVTFRQPFPALRLSRLSYVKRGNDEEQPSHFESVAAALPPGSLSAEVTLAHGLSSQGIWPVWNPWSSKASDVPEETLRGSAMALLGLSPSMSAGHGMFGPCLGDTHSPPSELRLVASHPRTGKIVMLEIPLCVGNLEFEVMVLGNPQRYVMSLSDVQIPRLGKISTTVIPEYPLSVSVDFESSRLRAELDGKNRIAITWRKEGTPSLLSSDCLSGSEVAMLRKHYPAFGSLIGEDKDQPVRVYDLSVVPVPLWLPPIRLPQLTVKNEMVAALQWWPDENYGGPPMLMVITSKGTVLVFEIPPPWSALEPAMPNQDPFFGVGSTVGDENEPDTDDDDEEEDIMLEGGAEYEVMITPHPDFGLGLRLESQMESGMAAVAGSFKKHPLNGGKLPAEKTGMILLGDELLAVNKVSLIGISFDEIIATVRQVGADAEPGEALCLRFRRAHVERRRRQRLPSPASAGDSSLSPEAPGRRTVEHIFGVKKRRPTDSALTESAALSSPLVHRRRISIDAGSLASMLVGVSGENQQEFSRLVAAIRRALEPSKDNLQSRVALLPWIHIPRESSRRELRASALLVIGEMDMLRAYRLDIAEGSAPDKACFRCLGRLELKSETEAHNAAVNVRRVSVVSSVEPGKKCLAVYECGGIMRLVFISLEIDEANSDQSSHRVSFNNYRVFRLSEPAPADCIVRAASADLIATIPNGTDGCASFTIWSPQPNQSDSREWKRPGSDDDQDSDYSKLELKPVGFVECPESDEILDVQFLRSGLLDPFPLVLAFLRSEVVVYRREGVCVQWKVIMKLAYAGVPSSDPLGPTSDCLRACLPRMVFDPLDVFPHIFAAVGSCLSSGVEKNLVSDWHPDSLVAQVCTETFGAKIAMKKSVDGLLTWLTGNANSNGTAGFDTITSPDPLLVAPLKSSCGHQLGKREVSDDEKASVSVKGRKLLREFQSMLCQRKTLKGTDAKTEFERPSSSKNGAGDKANLPPMLENMSADDLKLLWALCDLVLEPPDFQWLDPAGQLFIFALAIHQRISNAPSPEEPKPVASAHQQMPAFLVKTSSSVTAEKKNPPPQVATAACVAALACDCQVRLVEIFRQQKTLNWSTARKWRLPFWIRSDKVLRHVCELIGQGIFREGRDILESAVFYIASRKIRTLRNLAATDRSDSGRKFFSFITSYDFSNERGRRAAEKNAYSLLRKRRYRAAAAFFLLAEPPMLKSAVEVIASQLEDLDLAFLVARLVEDSDHYQFASSGMFGVAGGVMGGGGGYADVGAASAPISVEDEVKFREWNPALRSEAKRLIADRGLSMSRNDHCLTAVQLLWMGRKEEASLWLSGLEPSGKNESLAYPREALLTRNWEAEVEKNSIERVITRVNGLIEFTACPFLLTVTNAGPRARLASAFLVCGTLTRRGIELPAIRAILHTTDPHEDYEDRNCAEERERRSFPPNLRETSLAASIPKSSGMTSPIFDAFQAPQRDKSRPEIPVSGAEMESSIFDAFDAAPRPTQKSPNTNSGGMVSSIFDSFEPPPLAKAPPSGDMTSSIFDEFDAPPRAMTKSQKSPTSGEMTSSIFDTYDVPRSETPRVPAVAESSIFDAFDVPAAKPTINMNGSGVSSASTSPANEAPGSTATGAKPNSLGRGPEHSQCMPGVEDVLRLPPPDLWTELRQLSIISTVARRFLRDVAVVVAQFHGDAFDPPAPVFRSTKCSLVPFGSGEVLRGHCDGDEILDKIKRCLSDLCRACGVEPDAVVQNALLLLGAPLQHRRLIFSVLLNLAIDREDLAEDMVREVSNSVVGRSAIFAMGNDDVVHKRRTLAHASSTYMRKQTARNCWQLELCLWLHRGGALPLSGIAHNEAVVAVRLGLAMAAWNRSYDYLETMIRNAPECLVDHEAGRQLWTSFKLLSSPEEREKKTGEASSGGWEFLVDCRRAEATEMLRLKPTGTFIIRPHAEQHDVFTLSFKTNLVPTTDQDEPGRGLDLQDDSISSRRPAGTTKPKPVKRDDVVQHAIIRLSDSGFRCGSFGPFATLIKLLEAVSASLPFDLRFDQPPTDGVIREEGIQPSPNSVFFRKLASSHTEDLTSALPTDKEPHFLNEDPISSPVTERGEHDEDVGGRHEAQGNKENSYLQRQKKFGLFLELLVLSEIRKQVSGVVCAEYDELLGPEPNNETDCSPPTRLTPDPYENSVGSMSDATPPLVDEQFAVASRILRHFLSWCRVVEVEIEWELAPPLRGVAQATAALPVEMSASDTAIELAPTEVGSCIDGGDAVIKRMIQPGSGVEFRTLRLGDGNDSAMVVLFSKQEAVDWFLTSGSEKTEQDALARLEMMEKRRVIEPINLKELGVKAYSSQKGQELDTEGVRYRFVDAWEVEVVAGREGETRGASLGRERYCAFSLRRVASSCEQVFRSIGGLHLLGLWMASKGGVVLTKAIASVHAPWERAAGGDLCVVDGVVNEPSPFLNGIRHHLYRNTLFRRLSIPQRFLALIQVELLDLKNLTSPGGSLSLNVYAFLRMKRPGSGAPLTTKARTLDSAATSPIKLAKTSGPNAPASWGSLVRFRFPLPEDVRCDGVSFDGDRESLFKGPPCVLQVAVYEKKFMSDSSLGLADVALDGLASGSQLEEWVPLRTAKYGINWFARIRLTLHFELMCLAPTSEELLNGSELAPSVGLRRIQQLSQIGGAQEEIQKSVSTPDLLSYFESMVY